ncbi:MAG: hypothetical protein ACLFV8_04170 [Alphaproteobacteria bacterium]
MFVRNSLLSLCFFSVAAVAYAKNPDEVIDTTPVATFGNVQYPVIDTWLDNGDHLQTFDSTSKVRYCRHPQLLLCIEEPFPIFLPRTRKALKLKFGGSAYQAVVSNDTKIGTPDNVCESYAIWLRVRDLDRALDAWYLFFHKQGLSKIVTFTEGDNLDQVPGNILSLTSGRIFALEELCDGE